MDWLQFISNIVGSLAWPTVVVFFLFLIRNEIVSLVRQLKEITLPGGTKASFGEKLEQTKNKAEQIAHRPTKPTDNIHNSIISNASKESTPKKKINMAFNDLQSNMIEMISQVSLRNRRSPFDFMLYELRNNNIDPELYDLYSKYQETYLVSSDYPSSSISEADYIEFDKLTKFILSRFHIAFEEWKRKIYPGTKNDAEGN